MTTMFLDFPYILMELFLNIVIAYSLPMISQFADRSFCVCEDSAKFPRGTSLKIRLNHIEAEL